MKTLLLDVKTNTCEVYPVLLDAFPSYWEQNNAIFTTLIALQIGDTKFYAMCDDQACVAEDPHISAVSSSGEILISGSLMFFQVEPGSGTKTKFTRTLPFDAELKELTDKELALIQSHIRKVPTEKHPEGLIMLCDVERCRTSILGFGGGGQRVAFMQEDRVADTKTQEIPEQYIDYGRSSWEI